jgi:hypothetical protein
VPLPNVHFGGRVASLGQTLLCYTLRHLKTSRFVKSWVVSRSV